MPMSRSFLPLVGVLALALMVPGCGGGGTGSGSNNSSIAYQTTWNGSGAGPDGVSQRIQVLDQSGNLVNSRIINETGLIENVTFSNLPAGTYVVTAELNSALNFGGFITGVTSVVLTVNGGIGTFVTQVGEVPTHINVTPDTATITAQQSQQFEATPLDGSGDAVFVDPDDITWTTLGGVATVSNEGVVIGTTAGTGSVKATYVPLALTDAAVLNVNPFTPVQSKWTVLVYLNAANDLDSFGDLNVNQMEKVAGNANVRFIVQWKQALIPGVSESPSFQGTRRYLLERDTNTNEVHSQLLQDLGMGVDMGDWQTLHDFVAWGKTFYPSDRTVLVIWNHGNGWHRSINRTQATRGVSYDDEMGTSIETWQLNQAMGSNTVDILAWDASLMQMLEVNNEIRTKATYIVGSEESPPGAGYPYDTIFDHFVDSPDASTLSLAQAFVDETLDVPAYAVEKITQSVLDSSKLAALTTAMSQLGVALQNEDLANPTDFALYIQTARALSQTYSQSSARTYRDLIDLTEELDKTVGAYSPPVSITNATAAVRAAANDVIVHEGHNGNSAGSRGISIDFSPQSRFVNYQGDYGQLQFAQSTQWDEWLAVAP
jgi:hypothetical protein